MHYGAKQTNENSKKPHEALYISMLESGKRYPSIEMLIRIAIALEVQPGDILNRIAERSFGYTSPL